MDAGTRPAAAPVLVILRQDTEQVHDEFICFKNVQHQVIFGGPAGQILYRCPVRDEPNHDGASDLLDDDVG